MVKELTRKMKDSGIDWIGEIPQDVDIISNKYLFKYIKGKNPKEFNSEKRGLPYIGASDLEKDGDIHDYENYSIEELPTVEKDETLILWDGARAGLIGIGHTGYIGSTIVKIIPRVDYIDKRYWYWYLKGFQPLLLDWVGGTTIPHMNRKFINEIKFINFPLSQQKSIADFLDKKTKEINNIISKTKKAIEEYKKYKQSLITETVTKGLDKNVEMKDSGIEWLGEIPEHWDVIRLQSLVKLRDSKGLYNPKEDLYIGLENIESYTGKYMSTNTKYEESMYSEFKSKDILFNTLRPYLTKVYLTNSSGYCTSEFLIIKEYMGIKKYLFYQLINSRFIELINSSTYGSKMPRANWNFMKDIYLPISPLEEQEQISNYLDEKTNQIDQIISTKEKLLTEMEAYKKSLIYETVTGKREVK